jgi:hypothetical protein
MRNEEDISTLGDEDEVIRSFMNIWTNGFRRGSWSLFKATYEDGGKSRRDRLAKDLN